MNKLTKKRIIKLAKKDVCEEMKNTELFQNWTQQDWHNLINKGDYKQWSSNYQDNTGACLENYDLVPEILHEIGGINKEKSDLYDYTYWHEMVKSIEKLAN